MLTHLNDIPAAPARVVVLGAAGFVGAATVARLTADGVPVLALARQDMDLSAADAADKLAGLLRPDDSLVFISAKAPVKTSAMLIENLIMAEAVCRAVERQPVAHLVYVSSDAVYADGPLPLSERSYTAPTSLHGAMHLGRELMLAATGKVPLCVLRPTLIYGLADPHNGYGPNQFRRKAANGEDIVLFGEGEERRDHVLVEDVAELMRLCLRHRSRGVLNAATGQVWSFREVASMVIGNFERPVTIKGSPRKGPMPHAGYRPFDASSAANFPAFRYTPLPEGLAKVHTQMMEAR